jgi:heme/copper-type cytochrome/quinol oxidase subunit 2
MLLRKRHLEAPVSRPLLWISFFGGAVLWFVHFLLIWAIAEFGCLAGWQATTLLGITLVFWLILAVSIVIIAVTAYLTLVSYRARVAFAEPEEPELRGADHYMTRGGLWANLLFLAVIVVQTAPAFFFIQHC